MVGPKTRPTPSDVAVFLSEVEGTERRSDVARLVTLMRNATAEQPVLWGTSIVGFGRYHYRYASGHEGDSCLVGFSPRKTEFSIYLAGVYFPESSDRAQALLARLGKHRLGKACLYVKRLADIDESVLGDIIAFSIFELRRHYP